MSGWMLPPDADAAKAVEAQPDLAVAPRRPADWGERRAAAATMQRIEDDSWGHAGQIEAGLQSDLLGLLPPDLKSMVFQPQMSDPTEVQAATLRALSLAVARDPARYGKVGEDNTPLTPTDFNTMVQSRRQREYDEARSVVDAAPDGSWAAEFLGRSWASLTTPESLVTLPLGAPARVGWAARIGIEAALGAGSEALMIPARARVAEDLDVPDPHPLGDMLEAGLMAGGLTAGLGALVKGGGAAIRGGRRYLEYRSAGRDAARETLPPGTAAAEHAVAIDEAQKALENDQPLPEPKSVKDAQRIDQMLDFIGDHEAPRGYDQVHSGIAAADRPPKPLTTMTINEVLAWQDSIDSRYNSEAAGRFQIMEDTLRPLVEKLQLTGDELFDEAMQKRLATELLRGRGLDDFLAGRIDAAEFGGRIAREWAAVPDPATGRSHYDGFNGNASRASTASLLRALGEPGGYTSRMAGDTSPDVSFGPTRRGYTRSDTIRVGDDTRVGIKYEVVDASALTRASGRFQPRDRSQVNSDAWVAATAADLDPALLMPSPNAATGTPLVGPDGMIESGNGRFMALERAYARHPDRADAYRAEIEAAGFDIPQGVERPVLIARRTTDLTDDARAALTVAAQDSGVAQMTPAEISGAIARDLTPARLAMLDPARKLTEAGNAGFVQSVLAALPKSVRNGMYAGRELTADAVRMLNRAVFARAWDDPALIRAYVSAEDAGELKQLLGALEEAAPAWAAMRAEVSGGRLRPEFDITPHVAEAMTLISRARTEARAGGPGVDALLGEMLDDIDILDGALSPLTIALVKKLWPNGRAAPAPKVTEFLTRYADEARKIGGTDGGLFTAPGPADTLRAIDARTFAELPDDFGVPRGAGVDVAPAEALPETAFAKGAEGPEVEAAMQAAEVPPVPVRAPLGQTIRDLDARAAAAGTPDAETRQALQNIRDEFGEVEIDLGDGRLLTIDDIADDLDQDARLESVIDACMTRGVAV